MTIPASHVAKVIPSVVNAGGNPLALSAVFLTENTELPVGASGVISFPSQIAVSNYFGPGSTEAALATIYFNGFNGADTLPGQLWFARYVSTAVAGYMRGASLAGLTLTQLQAISGTITINVNGTPINGAASINLAGATSFTNAATLIQAQLTGVAVSYDAQLQGFVFTSPTTGAASTVGFATGTIAAPLFLTAATGAVLSPGAIASVAATFMDSVVLATQNWVSFMTIWEPSLSDKLAFALWNNGKQNRFHYAEWDSDVVAAQSNTTASFGYQATNVLQYSGFSANWNTAAVAAFLCGAIASTDFTETNGRVAYAEKSQSGFPVTVTDESTANNLEANNYNYYGAFATATTQFNFYFDGSLGGPFLWVDSYVGQIYLNSQFQEAMIAYLTQVKSTPYNDEGYNALNLALQDPITQGLNSGIIRSGVTLSSVQAQVVNQQAGLNIATVLGQRGWYLQIQPADPTTRQARKTPPMKFWYTDGQSIQQLTLSSIDVL